MPGYLIQRPTAIMWSAIEFVFCPTQKTKLLLFAVFCLTNTIYSDSKESSKQKFWSPGINLHTIWALRRGEKNSKINSVKHSSDYRNFMSNDGFF